MKTERYTLLPNRRRGRNAGACGVEKGYAAVGMETQTVKTKAIDETFLRALQGEDELGVVVRAHIHIEAGINRLLDLFVPHTSLLPRLRYEQRVRLACALGLHERYIAPLVELGNIRNQFGHRLDTKLTDKVIMKLFESFSESDKLIILAAFELTNKQLQEPVGRDFLALTPKSKFALIAVVLDKMLATAQSEARRGVTRRFPDK